MPHGCVANSCARRWQVLTLIPLQYPTEVHAWWYFCGQGTRDWSPGSCAAVSWMWRCGVPRVMFVDISPPAGTRVVGTPVPRGRRHGRGDGLHTWVCERRVCESQAATNGVRATVESRGGGVEGAGTTAEGYEYLFARVCYICVRYRIGCARTRSILPHLVLLYS